MVGQQNLNLLIKVRILVPDPSPSKFIQVSSNGRTADSDPANLGSNPST